MLVHEFEVFFGQWAVNRPKTNVLIFAHVIPAERSVRRSVNLDGRLVVCYPSAWAVARQERGSGGIHRLTWCGEEAVFHRSRVLLFARIPELNPSPPLVVGNLDRLSVVFNEQKSSSTLAPQRRGKAPSFQLEFQLVKVFINHRD